MSAAPLQMPGGQPAERPGRRRGWSSLGPTEKFIAYTRWSVGGSVLTVLAVLAVPVVFGEVGALVPVAALAAACAVLAVMIALAVAAVELRPELNSAPRRDHRPWNRASVGLNAAVWTVCLAVQLLVPSEGLRLLAILLGYAAIMIFCLVTVPWLPRRWWWMVVACTVSAAAGYTTAGADLLLWSCLAAMLTLVSVVSVWSVNLVVEAARAQSLEADLALTAERLRIAQELHDTMGHNLAAMSLKTEVALALARRGDDQLIHELEDLRGLAQRSATEMREVVGGYRAINLATELVSARSLLATAGIGVVIEGASLDVPEPRRELAAWTVREATTNILRHAEAREVRIHLDERAVVVDNDGAAGSPGALSGLEALRRRAESQGAGLHVVSDPPRFALTLLLDGATAPPSSAALAGPSSSAPPPGCPEESA